LGVLQEEEALYRVAYELAEDAAAENIWYMEVRYSPILHTKKGMKLPTIIDAVLSGLRRAEKKYDIKTGVIICGMRNISPESSNMLADLAVAYKNRGVVGFDLAGVEESYPAKHHREAFYRILNNNINTTAHAGEAYGPESIHQALHYCGAHRIGHGTRLLEDGDLLNYVNDHRIPLEICLTSNIQTKVVPSFEKHPLKFYYDFGLRITVNTDNRMISDTTLTKELSIAAKYANFNINDLKTIIVAGFKSAFLPMREKAIMLNLVNNELEKY
jgi:adenosine deaminase